MDEKEEECENSDDLDDLLEKEWELQDQIHKKCKMKEMQKHSKNYL